MTYRSIVMNTIKLNQNQLEPLLFFKAPASLPDCQFKNFLYAKAIDLMKYLAPDYVDIIEAMRESICDTKKYQYIDLKVSSIKKGEHPGNGFWHLDSSLNPDHYYENFLWCTGDNTTEFMTEEVDIGRALSIKDFDNKIKNLGNPSTKIPSEYITRFREDNPHRSPVFKNDETRVLVRLVNTDKRLISYRIK